MSGGALFGIIEDLRDALMRDPDQRGH